MNWNCREVRIVNNLGDAANCAVTGNMLDGIGPNPGISAGPGGGGHLIASNRIVQLRGEGLGIRAPGCVVRDNLTG